MRPGLMIGCVAPQKINFCISPRCGEVVAGSSDWSHACAEPYTAELPSMREADAAEARRIVGREQEVHELVCAGHQLASLSAPISAGTRRLRTTNVSNSTAKTR